MKTFKDIQANEANKLKAIYEARKQADPKLTQDVLAEQAGWSGQSVVSQYLNGRIPLNLPALLKFSSILGFDPKDVSPRLMDHLDHISPASGAHNLVMLSAEENRSLYQPEASLAKESIAPIEAWSDETPLGDDEIAIPFYKEVELAAGKGSEVMLETGGRKLRFGKRTLQRKGINADTAAAAVVTGNSMEPVLPDGSTVAIDTTVTAIVDGKMYAINHEGQLRVKLLYRLPGNGLRLRSYNTEEHPDERYDAKYVAEHIRIIGKVFWYSVLI
ncbi:LexA family transcriptional regulator [Stutzerimonas stutzeri]|uniref:LexA family transcriptional regulator n=1 Tax=Stutzerimonas stutzeri TaxID=316 RepID=UPI00244BEBCF|nr:helix-turn-helix transcriptional regulator [Stutzerimonas stutzeri]MDH0085297.1 helix-turn-helix transcriptional regulator [Stutzerimonas stutzeri]